MDIEKKGLLVGILFVLVTATILGLIQTTSTTEIKQVPCVDGNNYKIISPQNVLCEKQVNLLFGSEELYGWGELSPVIIFGIVLLIWMWHTLDREEVEEETNG